MIITLNKFKNNTGGSSGGSDLVDFSLIGYNKQQTEDALAILKADFQKSVDEANSWDPKTTSAYQLFYNRTDFSYAPYIDTSNVTEMKNMFSGCTSLKYIPKYDTSNVTNMENMFNGCKSLEEVPALDTSNVTTMFKMFSDCSVLKKVPALDTSNATSLYYLFNNCTALEEAPALNASKATTVGNMFYGCSALKKVPALDTLKATTMSSMFYGCTSLQEINGIDFSSLTSRPSTFWGYNILNSLKKVIVNGKIDFSWTSNGFTYTPNIDYDSIMSILTAMGKTTNTDVKTMEFNSTMNFTNEINNLINTCTSLGWTINGLTIKYPDKVYTGKEFYEAGFIKPLNENILIEVEGDDIIISGWDKLPINSNNEYYLDLYIASPVYWPRADVSCKADVPFSKYSSHEFRAYDTLQSNYLTMNKEQNLTGIYLGSNSLLRLKYRATPGEDVSAGVRFTIHTITTKEVNPNPISTINDAVHYYVTDSTTGTNIQNVEGLKLYNMYDLIYNDELGYYVCRVIDNEYEEDVYAYNYINRIGLSGDANTVFVTYNGVAVPTTRETGGNYNVTIDLAGINYNE